MESALSRKELEKEARKQDILEIAAELFAKKDFHSVTVDEIAEKIGLSKGTIYLYFDTKENLFFSILIERTKSLMKALQNAVHANEPFNLSIYQFVLTFLEFFQKNVAYFKLMHSEKTRSSIEAHYQMHDYADEIVNKFIASISQLLKRGVEEKYLKSMDILPMAKMLAGILNTFTFYRIFSSSDVSPEEETEMIIDLFLNGVKK
ncbi:TetR/AcrR family transcriptional regulator [bacterium]